MTLQAKATDKPNKFIVTEIMEGKKISEQTVFCPSNNSTPEKAIEIVESLKTPPSEKELKEQEQKELRNKVNQERDRRLNAGATVNVQGYGDIPIQGREVDRINMLALKDTAHDLISNGVSDPVLEFRDANNINHIITPHQMIDLVTQGKQIASRIISSGWVLKDGDEIPSDFKNDKYWK